VLVALLVAAVTATCQLPAKADHRSNKRWAEDVETVYVVDEVARTVPRGTPRQRWLRHRNKVLSVYSANSGITFVPYQAPPAHDCSDPGFVYDLPVGTLVICRTVAGSYAWPDSTDQRAAVVGLQEPTRSLVCHEVGHTMGLGHREPGESSCMVQAGPAQGLDAHDLETLADIYSY